MKALRRGIAVLLASTSVALAGGDWKNSPLHNWFEGLASKKGPCCSYADGVTLTDVEWDTKDGHYRVFLEGQWIEVPDDAIVVAPNKYGRAIVWPYPEYAGEGFVGHGDTGSWRKVTKTIKIRCFMPGAEA
jgi:hypothetical protein